MQLLHSFPQMSGKGRKIKIFKTSKPFGNIFSTWENLWKQTRKLSWHFKEQKINLVFQFLIQFLKKILGVWWRERIRKHKRDSLPDWLLFQMQQTKQQQIPSMKRTTIIQQRRRIPIIQMEMIIHNNNQNNKDFFMQNIQSHRHQIRIMRNKNWQKKKSKEEENNSNKCWPRWIMMTTKQILNWFWDCQSQSREFSLFYLILFQANQMMLVVPLISNFQLDLRLIKWRFVFLMLFEKKKKMFGTCLFFTLMNWKYWILWKLIILIFWIFLFLFPKNLFLFLFLFYC